jgi:hypothetical protein
VIPQWTLFILPISSHFLEHDQIQEEEQTLRRRLWANYAVKFPERAKRLRNSSGRFPERLFQISAFKARTKSINTMVWRSEHSQPVKRNLKKAKYRPLLADVDSQTKP